MVCANTSASLRLSLKFSVSGIKYVDGLCVQKMTIDNCISTVMFFGVVYVLALSRKSRQRNSISHR